MTKFYISGPITGLIEEEFTTNFGRAEAMLLNKDHEAVNPVKVLACLTEDCADGSAAGQHKEDGSYLHSWQCYMKHDIKSMMECDAILMIPGWNKSRGAMIELELAIKVELTPYYCDESYTNFYPLNYTGAVHVG